MHNHLKHRLSEFLSAPNFHQPSPCDRRARLSTALAPLLSPMKSSNALTVPLRLARPPTLFLHLKTSSTVSFIPSSSLHVLNTTHEAFEGTCGGIAGLPTITLPPGAPTVSMTGTSASTVKTVSIASLPKPSTTTTPPVTVTSASVPSPIVQKTVSSGTTTSAGGGTSTSSTPGIIKSGCRRGKEAGLAFVGALVGGVLAL